MSLTINYTTIKLQIPNFVLLIFDVMDGFTTIYIFCGKFLPYCEYIYIMSQILYFKKSPKIDTQLCAIRKSV